MERPNEQAGKPAPPRPPTRGPPPITNVIDFPQQAQATVDKVETHIETTGAELGNAGFACAVGETGLSLESLDLVLGHLQAARALLTEDH